MVTIGRQILRCTAVSFDNQKSWCILFLLKISGFIEVCNLLLLVIWQAQIRFWQKENEIHWNQAYGMGIILLINCIVSCSGDKKLIFTGLDISARPLAQASVKTVRRVQIADHLPGFGKYDFQLQNILFKISVTLCFPRKNNLHCPQLIAYNVYHFEISHKPGALSQINFWSANKHK